MNQPDPRVKDGICGVVDFQGSTEFICVRKPHAPVYKRRASDRTHKKGDLIFSSNAQSDFHYFVNRWPNRPKELNYGHEEAEA